MKAYSLGIYVNDCTSKVINVHDSTHFLIIPNNA